MKRVRFPGSARDFSSQCHLSVQALSMLFLQLPRASTSVNTLKIPSTGSHTIVWTQTIVHILVRLGSAALAAAVTLITQERRMHFPQRINHFLFLLKSGKQMSRRADIDLHACDFLLFVPACPRRGVINCFLRPVSQDGYSLSGRSLR